MVHKSGADFRKRGINLRDGHRIRSQTHLSLDFCKNKESEGRETFERMAGHFPEKFDKEHGGYMHLVCWGRTRHVHLAEFYLSAVRQ